MKELVHGEGNVHDVRQSYVAVGVSLKIKVIQECSQKHPELVLHLVLRIFKHIQTKVVAHQSGVGHHSCREWILPECQSKWQDSEQKKNYHHF